MKKILMLVAALLLIANIAKAQTVQDDLVGLGMKPEIAEYISSILPAGSVLGNNTYLKARNQANSADISVLKVDGTDDTVIDADTGDVIKLAIAGTAEVTVGDDSITYSGAATSTLNTGAAFVIDPVADANRKFTLGAASDTAFTFKFGDTGTTATQWLTISGSTGDADDDSRVLVGGGGDATQTRGGYAYFSGNEEAATGGISALVAGDTATGKVALRTIGAQPVEVETTNAVRWQFEADGDLANNSTNGGQINLSKAGTTLAIQEGTAGSACSGTLTANGATPVVVSTTCASTGARIFTQRTSAETGAVNVWISALTNGTSFAVTGEAADTGTYNWIIFKEAP